MSGRLLILIPVLLLVAGSGRSAETAIPADFARYAIIVDRQPFGSTPAGGEDAALPQDSFVTYVRLTALMQKEGGDLRVGFVDKKQKDKPYMLGVGETADDYEVLDADLSQELAKIRKGTEEQWLSMKTPGVASPPKRGAAVAAPAEPAPQPVRTADIRPNLAGLRRASRYAAIRRAEIERENAKKLGVSRPPPPQKLEEDEEEDDDGEEVVLPAEPDSDAGDEEDEENDEEVIREAEIQSHLQNYQKELIRQGLPPLPIPLTPETDAELVKEGLLDAMPAPDAAADGDDEEE